LWLGASLGQGAPVAGAWRPTIRRADTPPGVGPLGVRVVFRHTWGMLAAHFHRIAGAAFLFFAPTAVLFVFSEWFRDLYADTEGVWHVVVLAVLVTIVAIMRLLGQVLFSGFLDLAVGDSYFRGEDRTLVGALRELPWRALLIVDVVVAVGASIGLELFVVPGIAIYTLFGLVGPVVVQERWNARDGLRRTSEISRPHWVLVLVLVVIPLGVEHAFAEGIRHAVEGGGLVPIIAGEWFIAATMLTLVGVIDVALATELMARTPSRLRSVVREQ
jgi:hypothetical protein